MADGALLDNDLILKIACYDLCDEALAAMTTGALPPAMLGVGRFVVRGLLARARKIADPDRASSAFEAMLGQIDLVEPDDDELVVAAELEAEASRRDLELDGGESQLLAILANRSYRLLATGDKRAAKAMAVIASELARGRIACLEQVIAHLLAQNGVASLRPKVCAEPKIDTAVAVCFSCLGETCPGDEAVMGALNSYVSDLDRTAPGVLITGDGFGAPA